MYNSIDPSDSLVECSWDSDVRDNNVLVSVFVVAKSASQKVFFGRWRSRRPANGVVPFEELETNVAGDLAVDAGDEDDFG